MAVITWNEQMNVGIADIDQEHQKLLEMLAKINEAMTTRKGGDVMGQTVEGLAQYTSTHFAHEEQIMAEHDYPDYDRHAALHAEWTQRIRLLQQKHAEGRLSPLELFCLLTDWLKRHIQDEDKKIGDYLVKKDLAESTTTAQGGG